MKFKLAAILVSSLIISMPASAQSEAGVLLEYTENVFGVTKPSYLLESHSKTIINNETYTVNSLSFKGIYSYYLSFPFFKYAYKEMKRPVPVNELRVVGNEKFCSYKRSFFNKDENVFQTVNDKYSYNSPKIDMVLEDSNIYIKSNLEAYVLIEGVLYKIGNVKKNKESHLVFSVEKNPLLLGWSSTLDPITPYSYIRLSFTPAFFAGVYQPECPNEFLEVRSKLFKTIKDVKKFETESKTHLESLLPKEFKSNKCVNAYDPILYNQKDTVKCKKAMDLIGMTVSIVLNSEDRVYPKTCGVFDLSTDEVSWLNCIADKNIEELQNAELKLNDILAD